MNPPPVPEIHEIDPILCLSTAAITVVCFALSHVFVGSSKNDARRSKGLPLQLMLGTMIHSVVVSLLTTRIIFFSHSMVGAAKSALGFVTVQISFSHLAAETLTAFFFLPSYAKENFQNLTHHFVSCIALLLSLNYSEAMLLPAILRLFSQMSNPFHVVRHIMKEHVMFNSLIYLVNFLLLAATFFISRIGVIPFFWLIFIQYVIPSISLPVLVLWVIGTICLMLDILNIYWFCCMIYKLIEHIKFRKW